MKMTPRPATLRLRPSHVLRATDLNRVDSKYFARVRPGKNGFLATGSRATIKLKIVVSAGVNSYVSGAIGDTKVKRSC